MSEAHNGDQMQREVTDAVWTGVGRSTVGFAHVCGPPPNRNVGNPDGCAHIHGSLGGVWRRIAARAIPRRDSNRDPP
jgi:hypothetical protein